MILRTMRWARHVARQVLERWGGGGDWRNPKDKDYLEGLGLDRVTALEPILKEQDEECGVD
jgi:hypothetical protein